MAGEDWRAVRVALLSNSAITNFVAKGSDAEPIIIYGTIAATDKGLPAVSFRKAGKNALGLEDSFFIINCYGESEADSSDLSDLVNSFFTGSMGTFNSYGMKTTSKVLASVPAIDCINTPVSLRVVHVS